MSNATQIVEFFLMPVEDREASVLAGSYKTKDVEYIRIVNPKGLDAVEKEVNESVIKEYRERYNAWKESRDPMVEGVRIKDTALFSPSEIHNLTSAKVFTIEQLAGLSEAGMQALGMGARVLRNKAEIYLKSMNDHGKVVQEMHQLKEENSSLNKRLKDMEDTLELLKKKTPKVKEAA